ncbi:hypothetical protein N476_10900 [Pseudoalteromonas luteoviolacea H33]|uniref:Uncharacterized protein n=1 Tax=Pseudoalteromonas luteoviolacea H33 TaxID=1365251 RepID=A0A167FNR5_9GAMM|nr:hypothetical protein N476_10900 [Pseudoalteromonas luteoviolacea H33]KZN76505.1 hypothetical protein N477_15455 [Pseudoalteromonas luteoviolacea H33-S]
MPQKVTLVTFLFVSQKNMMALIMANKQAVTYLQR